MKTITRMGASLKGKVTGAPKQQRMTPEQQEEEDRRKEEERRRKEEERRRKEEEFKNRAAIVAGLSQDRVVWTDNPFADCWFFIKQSHVFIGILGCHELHPYSRPSRFLVAAMLAGAGYGLAFLTLDKEGDKSTKMTAQAASYSVTAILVGVHYVARHAAMCKCCVEGSGVHHYGGSVAKYTGKAVGKVVMLPLAIFCIVCLISGWSTGTARKIDMDRARETFLWSQVYSFVIGIISSAFLFAFYWWGCCCCDVCRFCCGNGQGAHQCGRDPCRDSMIYPYGLEYPNDMKMMWGGDRCSCVDPPTENPLCAARDDEPEPSAAEPIVPATTASSTLPTTSASSTTAEATTVGVGANLV